MESKGCQGQVVVSPCAALLTVLAKFWQPGQVKTRLAAAVGNDIAAELHRQFVAVTLSRLAGQGDGRWLAGTPADAIPHFRQLPEASTSRWSLVPQSEGNLGQRMAQLIADGFSAGFQRVVLLGSDSPDLPIERVEQAFARLLDVPVVIGPSTDGGYYLIGASRTVPPIFDDMPWSTASLFECTLRRLEAAGIHCALLERWRDVDNLSDLAALHERLTHAAEPLEPPLARLRSVVAGCTRPALAPSVQV